MPQADDAHAGLRSRLLAGDVAAGEKLTELGWAKRLGVGRAAVREALRKLAGEGLVEKRGASYLAPRLGAADVRELRLLREVLEVGAIRSGDGAIPARRLRPVAAALRDFERFASRDYSAGAREADLRFHRALVALAGSDRLLRMYDAAHLPLFQVYVRSPGRLLEDYELSAREHRTILAHLSGGRREEACAALSSHLRRGQDAVLGPVPRPA